MQRSGDAGGAQHRRQQLAVIQPDDEVGEPELGQRVGHRRAQLRFDDRRGRAERVDVALVELAEAPARRTVGAPHRLNLVALEQARQLRLVMRDDARERHGQVVAQREVRLPARLVLAALEDLEDELVALVAVLAEQRLEVLDRRRLERLEAVALVDALDDADDVLAAPHVFRQEVAHAARRFCAWHSAHAGVLSAWKSSR